MKSLIATVLLVLAFAAAANAEECLPSGSQDDTVLSGRLHHEIFPGPPNFEDVTEGDEPQPTYILELARSVCLADDEFLADNRKVRAIHLVIDADDSALRQAMRSKIGEEVTVSLRDLFGAHTRHHHAPIVAFVTGVWQDDDDPTEDYGTAATTVRGFYLALEVGDGEAASMFVIPDKRDGGPFSADALSAFYGNLKEPLSLLGVTRSGEREYEARYTFETFAGKVCDGLSIVTTTRRGGRNLIERIRAPSGC